MRFLIAFLLLTCSLFGLSLKDPSTGHLKGSFREFLTLFDVPENLNEEEVLCYLQNHWYQKGKDRWEMDRRFEGKKEEALPLLMRLKCIQTICAKENHYTYALVLGALGKTMERRLDFLFSQWLNGIRFDHIVLLTGQREVNPQLECVRDGIQSETELFVSLFENHPLRWVAPCSVIDSKKQLQEDGSTRRPTTETTVIDWLLTSPEPGRCLAVSSQPFVGYQEAVVRCLLPPTFQVEGIGPGTPSWPKVHLDIPNLNVPFPIAIYLDNFAKWLYYEDKYEKLSSEGLSCAPRGDGVDQE